MNEQLLQERINKVEDEKLRVLVQDCVGDLPRHFWMKPSSSTGKYHPKDEHLPGGLVLHTCRVVDTAIQLYESHYFDVSKDELIVTCILHDCARFGLDEKSTMHSIKNHATMGEWYFRTKSMEVDDTGKHIVDYGVPDESLERIAQSIGRHMGRWYTPGPESPLDWIVHLADMVASGYFPVKGEVLK